ncbi:DUF4390 domain-containing protein [Salidesulfovibrio onnuriiensis]|uniref:DUF4390 domain-containing protein n=1 Tax=Salidesulfovibrio onnuriiensis TaxID=2583823 RepID=UPI00164EE102|nr:DUF4390 domain-containing protein [Salidesulfovibrio onnuriiensis]
MKKYPGYGPQGAVLLLFLALALFPLPCGAQTLNLVHTSVARDGDALTARFGIRLGGVDEVAASLRNGVPLRLTCEARLSRDRKCWFGELLGNREMDNLISYDSLQKEFVLHPGGESRELRGPELAPLLEERWAEMILPLGKWDLLRRGESYSLQVKVALNRTEVPDWVSRALFFWDWGDGPSTSYKLDFRF